MNSGLTSHQQRGHTETGPRFKVSSERPEKRGIDLAIFFNSRTVYVRNNSKVNLHFGLKVFNVSRVISYQSNFSTFTNFQAIYEEENKELIC